MRRAASADLLGASAAVVTAGSSRRGHPRARGRAEGSSDVGGLVRARARWRSRRGLASAPALPTLAVAPVAVPFSAIPVAVSIASTAIPPAAVAPVAIALLLA